MTCEDLNAVLVDLVDGRLDGAAQRGVERHLEGCANCRALVEDLRSIRAAAFMLDRRVLTIGRRSNWPVWLGAAAALILATVIGLLPLIERTGAPQSDGGAAGAAAEPEVTVESVSAQFEAAEKIYQKAIDDLQTLANKDTGELDPQVASVLQKNLAVIDQQIAENRAALRTQPSSVSAQAGLFEGLRTKVALLQQTVELINEMRKGNQAEAGRRAQTFNQ
jgi:anti-sigma factor RsiW